MRRRIRMEDDRGGRPPPLPLPPPKPPKPDDPPPRDPRDPPLRGPLLRMMNVVLEEDVIPRQTRANVFFNEGILSSRM